MAGDPPENHDGDDPLSDFPPAEPIGPPQVSAAHAHQPNYSPPVDPYSMTYIQRARSDGAVLSLVLAIMAWVACGFFLSIPAVIIAHNTIRKIDADPRLDGRDMCVAALVIGYINIGLSCVGGLCMLLYFLLFVGIAAGGAAAAGS